MQFSMCYILALVIILLFGVGESVLKREKLNKWVVVICLLLEFGLTFVPSFYIGNIELSFAYSIFPFLISIYALFSLKSGVLLVRSIIGILLTTIVLLMYQVIVPFYAYEYYFLQPYLLVAPILAVCLFFIAKTNKGVTLSVVWGALLSSVITSGLLKNTGYVYINFGGEMSLSIILISISLSFFVSYVYRRLKLMQKRRQRKNSLQRN